MPRKYLKCVLPGAEKIRRLNGISWIAHWLGDGHLWHINRRSVALGVAIGLFFAFWPVPSQTLLAALGALLLRANLPVSIIFVWVSNPLTYLPLFGGAYLMGGYLLGIDTQLPQQLSLEALSKEVGQLWLGCMVLGVLSAASGWLLVRGYWYWHVHSSWHERRRLRKQQIDVNQSVRHP